MNETVLKKAIEQMIRQEIRNIVGHTKDTVRKEVRAQLIPELRAAIQDLIFEVIEGMEEKSSPIARSVDTSKTAKVESSQKTSIAAVSRENEETQEADSRGRYLYCVAEGNKKISLGRIGIDHSEVYTIPYKDLCAVVHKCPAEPYKHENKEVVENWVKIHQEVLDVATEKFGTILPLGFDTIIKDDEGADPEKTMKKWLEEDYENLKQKMEKVRAKAEYGVQIFWDPKIIGDRITENSEEIKKLDQEIKTKPRGMAYMYKQKLQKALKKEMEREADQRFKDFYTRIKKCVDDLKVEKTKKAEKDKQMLLNLSCLVGKNGYKDLGEELEKINKMDGFSVRFTGPWPPYSFVN
jgi:hypothetical protein